MFDTLITTALLVAAASQTGLTSKLPTGLWQNKEKGIVVRVEACGNGFCGFAAGVTSESDQKRENICGRPMLKNFTWNSNKNVWEGHMQPPDMNRTLDAEAKTDGSTYLTIHAHMMMMSKTIDFVPFAGQVTRDCRVLNDASQLR